MTRGGTPIPRPSSRVLLIDADDRLLLLSARFRDDSDDILHVPVGGGLEGDETHEEAARRELLEETGLTDIDLGPCVWRRRHVWHQMGRAYESRERYYVARVAEQAPPTRFTVTGMEFDLVTGRRWWTHAEIVAATGELFVPRRLAECLPPLLRGDYPAEPFDIGV